MKIATLRQIGGRGNFVSRWLGAAAGLWLAAFNLYATLGPTNVVTITGGWFTNGVNGPYHGYSDDTTSANATFNFPSGLALDPSGNSMFIADYTNNAVRWYSNPNSPGSGIQVYTFVDTNNGVSRPVAVAVDLATNVYVLNRGNGTNGYILEFTNNGDFFDYPDYGTLLAYPAVTNNTFPLTNATAVAFDYKTNLYVVCNSNTVIRVAIGGISSVIAFGTNSFGAIGTNVNLRGVAVMNNGLLALADAGNNGIWTMTPTNNAVASRLTGFHGTGDTNGPPILAAFNHPEGIAAAGSGWLVVADRYNHEVKTIDPAGNVRRLFGVNSNLWWTGTDPLGHQALPGISDGLVDSIQSDTGAVQAREPFGLVVAPDGSVYDTEVYYHLIRHATSTGLPPPPPLPPSLTATQGYGQVVLTWSSSSGATNYNVKRSTTPGGEVTIASTAGTSYTDLNVVDGTTYYYVVSALNTSGESQNSGEVSATPLFSPPPVLSVVATNYNLVSLSWSVSPGATSYNLKRSQATNGPFTTIASVATNSCNDTSVTNGDTYYYVVTAVNNGGENPTNSNEVSATPPLPPVPDPQIGYVTFPPPNFTSVFHPGSQAGQTFNNDSPPYIVIIGTVGSQTFYTYTNTANVNDVPDPTSSSSQVSSGYQDGLTQGQVAALAVGQFLPNLAVKAIGEESNYPNSAIVSALFQFVVGNPNITGNNAAQFTVNDITSGAQFLYTIDGSDPRTNASATLIGPQVGTNGVNLSLTFPSNTNQLTFQIVGIKANYQTSSVVSLTFSVSNFVPNSISFGFASGPGSTKFVASPGQSFTVPVGLSLLSGAPPIYGLQFNVTLTNLAGPVVDPISIDFGSLLGKPDAPFDGYYQTIPPWMFISDSQPDNDPYAIQYQGDWYQNLEFLDTNNEALLGVGWLEIYGRTNLYDTKSQNLLTYPILRGNDPYPSSSPIVGFYTFAIPTNAVSGDIYQIQIGLPSATTFPGLSVNPYGVPVYIQAPANTNISFLGAGSVNALKDVTIGSIPYLVGDVYPANWFNAGDFGSSNLVNVDVIRVFDFAAYPIAQPPSGSDLFDALDSCGNFGMLDSNPADLNYGYLTNADAFPSNFTYSIINYTYYENTNGVIVDTNTTPVNNLTLPIYLTTYIVNEMFTNTYIITNADLSLATNVVPENNFVNIPPYNSSLFSGSDTNINQIAFGDGVLDVCDVYVTFRRSLDTNNLVWIQRMWTNGVRVAIETNASAVISGAVAQSSGGKILPANSTSGPGSAALFVNFIAGGTNQASPGGQVTIPITAAVLGSYPLRVAMLNISAVPLDGSPALTTPISFSPGALGTPTSGFVTSDGAGNYAAAWLNSSISGISNNGTLGTLTVTIPANATSLSAYAIHFDSASGSPNGLGTLPKQTWTGLITVSSRTNSSYADGIPDSWRLLWFGTTNNLLSMASACPSGDGVSNWKKYVAGVDPNAPNDFPSLNTKTPVPSGSKAAIHWPTVYGKQYMVLSSASLFPGSWATNATVTGTGGDMEYDDSPAGSVKFYRVLILP